MSNLVDAVVAKLANEVCPIELLARMNTASQKPEAATLVKFYFGPNGRYLLSAMLPRELPTDTAIVTARTLVWFVSDTETPDDWCDSLPKVIGQSAALSEALVNVKCDANEV